MSPGCPAALVPLALMVFGLGMVVGNLVGGQLADISVIRALYVSMAALGVVLALFVAAAHNPWTAMLGLFLIGAAGSAIGPALQTRLMDVAARRADAGRGAEPLRAQHRQCGRRLDRRSGDRRRIRLHRTRRRRRGAGRRGLLVLTRFGAATTLDGALQCEVITGGR